MKKNIIKWKRADVGIITFHCADNYGAMLQAYGLKEYLCGIGIKTNIIRYEPVYMTGRHWWIPYAPIGDRQQCIQYTKFQWKAHREMGKDFFKLRRNMRRFRKRYLIKNNFHKILFSNQLKRIRYKYIIVGSDQIWNPGITCGLRGEYFGAFENKKREKVIAYAASLGGESLSAEYDAKFAELLKSVNAISVREETAIPYVKQFYSGEVEAVLDPVFFLEKEVWEKIAKKPQKSGYILIYTTERNAVLSNYAKMLSKKMKAPVIELRTNAGFIDKDFDIEFTAGPAEFLGYISNAGYVVTNSFHAVAFSIIFEKEFNAFLHKTLGARIYNVLNILGLENRIYQENNQAEENYETDWNKVKERTKEGIKASQTFLLKHLSV